MERLEKRGQEDPQTENIYPLMDVDRERRRQVEDERTVSMDMGRWEETVSSTRGNSTTGETAKDEDQPVGKEKDLELRLGDARVECEKREAG